MEKPPRDFEIEIRGGSLGSLRFGWRAEPQRHKYESRILFVNEIPEPNVKCLAIGQIAARLHLLQAR